MEFKDKTKVSELVCCPPLQACKNCDTIDVKYRLPFRPQTQRGRVVPVEVLLHFRFERCSGELTLGDLAYPSTLMPGELELPARQALSGGWVGRPQSLFQVHSRV